MEELQNLKSYLEGQRKYKTKLLQDTQEQIRKLEEQGECVPQGFRGTVTEYRGRIAELDSVISELDHRIENL